MSKGWHRESKRHSLAARGIRTGHKRLFKKTTDVPYYDQGMQNKDYMKRAKQKKFKIKYMSPKKYIKEAGKIQKSDEETQRKMIVPELVDKYHQRSESGERMPMPYLDYSEGTRGQEGRHRVAVAEKMGAKEVPVLVVEQMSDKEWEKFMRKNHPDIWRYKK